MAGRATEHTLAKLALDGRERAAHSKHLSRWTKRNMIRGAATLFLRRHQLSRQVLDIAAGILKFPCDRDLLLSVNGTVTPFRLLNRPAAVGYIHFNTTPRSGAERCCGAHSTGFVQGGQPCSQGTDRKTPRTLPKS